MDRANEREVIIKSQWREKQPRKREKIFADPLWSISRVASHLNARLVRRQRLVEHRGMLTYFCAPAQCATSAIASTREVIAGKDRMELLGRFVYVCVCVLSRKLREKCDCRRINEWAMSSEIRVSLIAFPDSPEPRFIRLSLDN